MVVELVAISLPMWLIRRNHAREERERGGWMMETDCGLDPARELMSISDTAKT